MNTRRKIILGATSIILLATLAFTIWAYTPLGPSPNALNSLISTENVTVIETDVITFTPKNQTTTGFILYPGGRVDPRSYSPIAHRIAENGILAVIPQMPFNLAVLDKQAAIKIINTHPEIKNWTIGGHSLGGSMAASLVHDKPEQFNGLILMAAYPPQNINISTQNIKVTTIYGTNDQIATQQEIEQSLQLLPPDTNIIPIEGGNHAQFGDYGPQDGDGTATITIEEQQEIIVNAILEMITTNK